MGEGSSRDCVVRPVCGMESVIATVSGYHGSERFNLIKLISHAGASYVGNWTKSTTHLICWKHEGSKYNLAKSFNTIVVNHKWLEDCIKQGKRVPEHPFMLQSGQEVGPLLLQIPQDAEAESDERRVLSDQSNISLEPIPREVPRVKDLKVDSLSGSSILEKKQTESRHTSRRVSGENIGLLEDEELIAPSARLVRKRDKLSNVNGSSMLAESSRRRRKLVKKYSDKETSNGTLADRDEDCYIIEPANPSSNAAVSEEHHDSAGNREEPEMRTGSYSSFSHPHGQANDNVEDVENPQFVSRDVYSADLPTASALAENLAVDSVNVAQTDDCADLPTAAALAENLAVDAVNVAQTDDCADLPTAAALAENLAVDAVNVAQTDDCAVIKPAVSNELSCVICLTDFSLTRGVLPCGHRFCYSCIVDWANHMAASRKASTCPLCKASFQSIMKVEDASCSDQKIYSQTIPTAQSGQNVYIIAAQAGASTIAESSADGASVCIICHLGESEDLLRRCHLCQTRCIHICCLDPPLLPWTCVHCIDLQRHYRTY